MNSDKPLSLFHEEEFLGHLQFNLRYSQNTVAAYKRDLHLYRKFQKQGKDIREFYQFLSEKDLSARSQSRVISCGEVTCVFCKPTDEKTKRIISNTSHFQK